METHTGTHTQILKSPKTENLENSKREVTHHIQGILSKHISHQKLRRQKTVGNWPHLMFYYLRISKVKELSTKKFIFSKTVLQRARESGAWVVQLLERPALDFGSGHDLTVHEIELHIGLHADSTERIGILSLPLFLSLLLHCLCLYSFSLSK